MANLIKKALAPLTPVPGIHPMLLLAGVALLLSACSPEAPSPLNPVSRWAAEVAGMWWFMLALAVAVYTAVMTLLLVAVLRRRRGEQVSRDAGADDHRFIVIAGMVVPAVIIIVLFGLALRLMNVIEYDITGEPLEIEIVAKQWWWEVSYPDYGITTANEFAIPVGQPVTISVTSSDVIHSFWVPQVHGKIDALPGHTNAITVQADQPGRYRGQCAEFCGLQHARMEIYLTALEPDAFNEWAIGQQQAAEQASTEQQQRGLEVFGEQGCGACHSIDGVEQAAGRTGPNLTHLASRETLGAGTLPNERPYLATWVSNAPSVKPGIEMPPHDIPGEQMDALLAYLMNLK